MFFSFTIKMRDKSRKTCYLWEVTYIENTTTTKIKNTACNVCVKDVEILNRNNVRDRAGCC